MIIILMVSSSMFGFGSISCPMSYWRYISRDWYRVYNKSFIQILVAVGIFTS
jgi:hypothetical protein